MLALRSQVDRSLPSWHVMHRSQTVPRQHGEKWVAWTPEGLYLVGAGDTFREALQAAQANRPDPATGWVPSTGVAYEWIPSPDERYLGPLHA